MKVAFATRTGSAIDEHFGRAATFAVWDITPDTQSFLESRSLAQGDLDAAVVSTRGMGKAHDDAISTKIDRLADCKIVYFTEIGGPSAAKLVQRGIMPLKAEEGSSVETTVSALAQTMTTNPAPWMRKALAAEK